MDLKPNLLAKFCGALLTGLGLFSFHDGAWAQRSCLPSFNSLQVLERMVPDQPHSTTHLLNEDQEHRPWVEARIDYSVTHPGSLEITFKFEDRFEGFSLPYNVFAILVLVQGQVVSWMDFTEECQSIPLSFFPGQEITLPLGTLPEATSNLQIMVW